MGLNWLHEATKRRVSKEGFHIEAKGTVSVVLIEERQLYSPNARDSLMQRAEFVPKAIKWN